MLNILNQVISYNLSIFNELLAFRILSNISTTAVSTSFLQKFCSIQQNLSSCLSTQLMMRMVTKKHKHSLYPVEVETIKTSYKYINLTIYLHDSYISLALSCPIHHLYYIHYVQSIYISSSNTLFTT